MRKTRIIATLGPASSSETVLKQLMTAGVNVFRLNFSHGTHEGHARAVETINRLNEQLGTHVAILADLSGPKIRTGEVEHGSMELVPEELVTISSRPELCRKGRISVNYPDFASDVMEGEGILLDDGKILLKAVSSDGKESVTARVVQGGTLLSRKGVNLPDTRLSLPSLSEKDLYDLDFILKQDIQWVALSFVRTAGDIEMLRKRIAEAGLEFPPRIVAKIEKPEAVANAAAIIRAADAVMIARGDLGVEIPQEKVPIIQKKIVRMCIAASRPVIVATQMMEGMIASMRPTRAEVSDVANSVLDGADAVMLSGETSIGRFPVETVNTMRRIITDVESGEIIYPDVVPEETRQERRISDAVIMAAADLARKVNARALIAMTHTGYSAFKLASHRTPAGIYIFSDNRQLLCALSLVWGVEGIWIQTFSSTDSAMPEMRKKLIESGFIVKDDYIIYVSSIPIGKAGKTNMLKLSVV